MKIIETSLFKLAKKKKASLIKEEQNVFTPEMEDEFADQQSNLWKKRRELGLGGPIKRKNRKKLRKGIETIDPNMDDKGWAKFITKKLKEKDDFSGAPF